jgi:CubicO group peptidase (beta-lactamase class C family)
VNTVQTLLKRLCFALLLSLSGACAAPSLTSEAPTTVPQSAPTTPVLPTAEILPTATPPATVTIALPTATSEPTLVPTAVPTLEPTVEPTAPPPPTPQPIDPTLAAELQVILDRLVADGYIPGAVLTVSIPGQAPWSGASGIASRSTGEPITPATQMRIASISKIFTAVVILQLYEEGRLDLEAPLSTWFPDLVPRSDQITVRRLLNHTTGLYDYLEDGNYLSKAYQKPDYRWQPAELATYAGKQGFLFKPGTPGAWDYSSTNYVILGMIAEQVTGNSLAQEMRTRIFAPLDLQNTYFSPDEEVQGQYSRGYRHGRDISDLSLSFAFATANLVSTTADVQRFGDALFSGQLLRPETMERLYTFENGKGQYGMPSLEYGLGVMRNRLPVGPDAQGLARPAELTTVLGHTGGFGGFRSVLWHQPGSGITIALGENQGATDPNILATLVLDAVLRSQGR